MYQKVLLAFDGSPCAELALQEALQLVEAGASLRILMVLAPLPRLALAPTAGLAELEQARALMEALRLRLEQQHVEADYLLLDMSEAQGSDVVQEILGEARDWGADLLVLGSHGRHGLQRLLLGSVAESVLRQAHCPVLLVRQAKPGRFGCLQPTEIYGMWPGVEAPHTVWP